MPTVSTLAASLANWRCRRKPSGSWSSTNSSSSCSPTQDVKDDTDNVRTGGAVNNDDEEEEEAAAISSSGDRSMSSKVDPRSMLGDRSSRFQPSPTSSLLSFLEGGGVVFLRRSIRFVMAALVVVIFWLEAAGGGKPSCSTRRILAARRAPLSVMLNLAGLDQRLISSRFTRVLENTREVLF